MLASGTPVVLPPLAFGLLVALVEREGGLATKESLLKQLWPGVRVEENSLHVQISTLRKVLGQDAIATVSGSGYRFTLAIEGVAPSPTQDARPRHNLVRQLTSFVGRECELAELKDLLRGTRLVTISGAGGCGKTRLARQLAVQIFHEYADGAWLVELAPVPDGQLLPEVVAEVLGVKKQASESLTHTLAHHLASRNLLLILDNAEHLLEASAELAQVLLERCQGLAVLVTSRERLAVLGETTYRIPSLSVPDLGTEHSIDRLLAHEAPRLFIERARLQNVQFEISAPNARSIASICVKLDGIPLAIELAAARTRALSVTELDERLDQRFNLLTNSTRAAPPRHRTLAALLDWSYGLLSPQEKAIWCRASAFGGGITLDAAERVLAGGCVDEIDMLDLLTSLADKSLLQVEEQSGVTRYRQLQTVRQYGRDKLRESGAEATWQRRHREHFIALAELCEEGFRAGDWQAGSRRLDADVENLRAALATALAAASERKDDGDGIAGLRLAGALFPYWWRSLVNWGEGRSWLLRLLDAVPRGVADSVRAKALNAAGRLAYQQADPQLARLLLEEAVLLRRGLGERRGLAAALNNLAEVLASLDDAKSARTLLVESLSIRREERDHWGVTRVLMTFVELECSQANLSAARAFAQEGLDVAHKIGGPVVVNEVLHWMATVVLEEGDAQGAVTLCRDALATVKEPIIAHGLLDIAASAECVLGGSIRPAVILGHLEKVLREAGGTRSHLRRRRHARTVAVARATLGDDEAFETAWQRGASMSTEQTIGFALRREDFH